MDSLDFIILFSLETAQKGHKVFPVQQLARERNPAKGFEKSGDILRGSEQNEPEKLPNGCDLLVSILTRIPRIQ